MGMVEAVKTCFSKYADFSGRALRSEFWWFFLFGILIQIIAVGLSTILPMLGILAAIFGIALFVPQLAVGARRLHDRNMSGWFQLLMIIPLLGIIILIILWAMKGTDGENKFGTAP